MVERVTTEMLKTIGPAGALQAGVTAVMETQANAPPDWYEIPHWHGHRGSGSKLFLDQDEFVQHGHIQVQQQPLPQCTIALLTPV